MTDQTVDPEGRERRLREQLSQAGQAERIFDDPMFVEAVKAVESDLLSDLQTIPLTNEGESLKDIRLQLDALKAILVKLRTYADGGKVAIEELSILDKMKDRIRSTLVR